MTAMTKKKSVDMEKYFGLGYQILPKYRLQRDNEGEG